MLFHPLLAIIPLTCRKDQKHIKKAIKGLRRVITIPIQNGQYKAQEIDELFSDDRYLKASHEKLNRALQGLVNDHSIDNNTVIRALVINTVLSDRHNKKVEDQNIRECKIVCVNSQSGKT